MPASSSAQVLHGARGLSKLAPPNPETSARFGTSVEVTDDGRVLVGDPTGRGKVYVFATVGGSWERKGCLPHGILAASFGTSLGSTSAGKHGVVPLGKAAMIPISIIYANEPNTLGKPELRHRSREDCVRSRGSLKTLFFNSGMAEPSISVIIEPRFSPSVSFVSQVRAGNAAPEGDVLDGDASGSEHAGIREELG